MIKLLNYALISIACLHSAQAYEHLISQPTPGPFYRKISLNGSFHQEVQPQNQEQGDSEPEESYVDALTLDLRHSVTDIYVTFIEDYLPMEVRRNWHAERFQSEDPSHTSLAAHPFGYGWTTGIGNFLQLTDISESAIEAVLLDEQGIAHHFMAMKRKDAPAVFFPISDTGHHQDSRRMQLQEQANGQYVFTKPFGTQLTFEALPLIDEDATIASTNSKRIFRCLKATHPSGIEFTYRYAPNNKTTIPHEINFNQCRISIETNTDGLISRIVDPRGYAFLYEYKTFPLEDGTNCQALSKVYKPIIDGKRSFITYDYEVVKLPQPETKWQISLSQIRDGRGHSHLFRYQDDQRATSSPKRVIKQIKLPGTKPVVSFASEWLHSNGKDHLATLIQTTLGDSNVIEFRDWSNDRIHSELEGLRSNYYTRILTKRFDNSGIIFDHELGRIKPNADTKLLCIEAYLLNPNANFGLREAIDLNGSSTKYIYDQALPTPSAATGLTQEPVQYYSEINQIIDAMGHTTSYTYGGPFHQELSRIDAEGRVREYERASLTGEITKYTLFASEAEQQKDQPIFLEEYSYEDPRFPGFCTLWVTKQLNITDESPAWECDLITKYEADELGRLRTVIGDPGGLNEITAYRYHLNGSRSAKSYRNGYTEFSTYDGYNQLREVFYPSDQQSKYIKEDERSNDVEVRYTDGTIKRMEYNQRSLLTKETTITTDSIVEVSTGYNDMNMMLYEKNDGVLTEYSYDPLYRVTRIKSPEEVSDYKYDGKYCSSWLFEESELKPSWVETTGSYPYTIEYDPLQRMISNHDIIDGTPQLGGQYTYDKVGNKILEILNGERTEYTYDAMNRLLVEVKPDGTEVKHLYTSTNLHYGTSNPDGTYKLKIFDAVGDDVTPEE